MANSNNRKWPETEIQNSKFKLPQHVEEDVRSLVSSFDSCFVSPSTFHIN